MRAAGEYRNRRSGAEATWRTLKRVLKRAYRQRFSFLMQGKGLVVEAVSVEAVWRRRPGRASPRHACAA